ncbi:MAG: hypothetical protein JHC96_10520 [Brevundimonas sp.]|uniref:hypothetical protein n=1 Tax=Brevundimonas sp. TaxID=1871086 RepID=UPI001A1C908F|nr:hypothetical protein [Brevundimonas sp.]MBJ7319222.1 hypothetical protein [Brevundimonas sp.]
MIAAEAVYAQHGENSTLYLIPGTDGLSGPVSTAEMERVYKGTFVKSKGTRELYGALKSAPENDICPLCSQRTVSQLDHHLPQSAHPALTVTPINLVPACSECNKTKLAQQAVRAGEQTFHPYFEDADDDRWLFAVVKETTPASVYFFPQPPAHWEAIKAERIGWHFATYKLAELYASHAAVELNDIKFGLQEMAERNSPEEISIHLRRVAASRAAAHVNSWRRATYEALADSAWFCGGGFG